MINKIDIYIYFNFSKNISKLASCSERPRSADPCQIPIGLLIRVQPASQCYWGRPPLGYHKAPWESLANLEADPPENPRIPDSKKWMGPIRGKSSQIIDSENPRIGKRAWMPNSPQLCPRGRNGIQIRWRQRDRSTYFYVLVIKRAIHGHQHVESVSS